MDKTSHSDSAIYVRMHVDKALNSIDRYQHDKRTGSWARDYELVRFLEATEEGLCSCELESGLFAH